LPIFYQQTINAHTKLGIWKIEEAEEFFLQTVPLLQSIKHPHKRLQHLAGRYLLQYLFPLFPYNEIAIANARKPYLPQAQFHFSISHCGHYAAAIVSKNNSAGIDIEMYSAKTERVKYKFLNEVEIELVNQQLSTNNYQLSTLFWCCKEAVYKWWGLGGIDFRRDILIQKLHSEQQYISVLFTKETAMKLVVQYILCDELCLAFTIR